ncbi:hypothetical protein C0993_012151 [Termitomyces sp. T159_Od127]|nr:hypothetical protein C0993_012151 [Termitomyces sp. T159_Od127]
MDSGYALSAKDRKGKERVTDDPSDTVSKRARTDVGPTDLRYPMPSPFNSNLAICVDAQLGQATPYSAPPQVPAVHLDDLQMGMGKISISGDETPCLPPPIHPFDRRTGACTHPNTGPPSVPPIPFHTVPAVSFSTSSLPHELSTSAFTGPGLVRAENGVTTDVRPPPPRPEPASSSVGGSGGSSEAKAGAKVDNQIPCKLPPEIVALCDTYVACTPVTVIASRAFLERRWGVGVPPQCGYAYLGFFVIDGLQERRVECEKEETKKGWKKMSGMEGEEFLRDPQQSGALSHPANVFPAKMGVEGERTEWGDGMVCFEYFWDVAVRAAVGGAGAGEGKVGAKGRWKGKGKQVAGVVKAEEVEEGVYGETVKEKAKEVVRKVSVLHVFTGNDRVLQRVATALLRDVQIRVPLERQMCSTNPYFMYTTPKEETAWLPTVVQAKNVMCARAKVYAEREVKVGKVEICAWVLSGKRKGTTSLDAVSNPVVLMLLGCEVEVTIVPQSGFPIRRSEIEDVPSLGRSDAAGVDDINEKGGEMRLLEPGESLSMPESVFGEPMVVDGGSLPGMSLVDEDGEMDMVLETESDGEDVDMGIGERLVGESATAAVGVEKTDVQNPAKKPGRKPGKSEKQAVVVTLVHGDVLVLSGDVFKYSLKRVGTSIFLICGGTDWPKLGKKERGGALRNDANEFENPDLLEPHILRSLANIRIRSIHTSCNGCHFVAVDIDGAAWLFGRNSFGALGIPPGSAAGDEYVSENAPMRIVASELGAKEGTRFVHAACGRNHTILVGSDGSAWSAGQNNLGQCGHSVCPEVTSFRLITGVGNGGDKERIVKASAGATFSLVLTDSGKVFSFGSAQNGQLGNGTTGERITTGNKTAYDIEVTPVYIKELDGKHILDIVSGPQHSLALDDTGVVYVWGYNGYCRLGLGNQVDVLKPKAVPQFAGPSSATTGAIIAAGPSNSVVVDKQGMYWMAGKWKNSGEGSAGSPYSTFRFMQDIQGCKISLARSGGVTHWVLTPDEDDTVMTVGWGQNAANGELGLGPDEPKSATKPTRVIPLNGIEILDIAAGANTTVFLSKPSDKMSDLPRHPIEVDPPALCVVCSTERGDDDSPLECDKPPLSAVPEGEWFCVQCSKQPGAPIGRYPVRKSTPQAAGKMTPNAHVNAAPSTNKRPRAPSPVYDEDDEEDEDEDEDYEDEDEVPRKRKSPSKKRAGECLLSLSLCVGLLSGPCSS